MAEEQTITLDDKQYKVSDMDEQQQAHIEHIGDLDGKIKAARFNLDQLLFGRQAFVDSLKNSLAEE